MKSPRINLSRIAGYLLMTLSLACSKSGQSDFGQAKREEIILQQEDSRLSTQHGVLYFHETPFTGQTVEYYENGKLAYTTPYVDGKEEGMAEGWFANGVKMEERFYKEGKKEGKHRGWWENGSLRFEYDFDDDRYEGEVKEWYEDGTPYSLFHYVEGNEEGSQQMWNEDGTIKANYVVQNGRRYGSMGVKPCRTLDTVDIG